MLLNFFLRNTDLCYMKTTFTEVNEIKTDLEVYWMLTWSFPHTSIFIP